MPSLAPPVISASSPGLTAYQRDPYSQKEFGMPINNALAGIAVTDLQASIAWYQKLLGRAADTRPMPEVAEWKFPRGGWLQLFQDADRAGACSVTLTLPDMDHELGKLAGTGITVEMQNHSPRVNTAIVRDPDGNQVVLAQALVPDLAQ
jgi:catechol 2,3-dioxygenase-like lactoylglutathione lyase family enzyme